MTRMSARILGQEIGGLTAAETNMLLCEEGFLEGEPGAWGVTEKGAPYATETDYHRGTGGYDMYNRYWTERTWDGSILDEIGDVPLERRMELSEKVALHRKQARERNLEPVDVGFTDESVDDTTDEGYDYGDAGRILLGLAAAGFLTWAACKAAPYVRTWWTDTAHPALADARQRLMSRIGGNSDQDGDGETDSVDGPDME